MAPTTRNAAVAFLGALVAVASLCGCRSAQEPAHPVAAPEPEVAPEPTPEPYRPSGGDLASEAAVEVADDVLVGGMRRARASIAALPEPAWSTFPGMEGERLREPLTRVEPEGPRPVLIVMIDTTRADRLGAYGHHRDTTPHIDRVAAEGVRFSRFYGNGAWTRPSVVSMLTSRYRGEHQVEVANSTLPEEETTLAELFKGAGYATAAFVGNQSVTHRNGFDQGFDTYEDPYGELEHHPRGWEVADQAIQWLEGNDNPNFFIWMFVVDPHDPYEPIPSDDIYETDYSGPTRTPKTEYDENMPSERYIERMLAEYDGEIRGMDRGIGKLFTHLDEAGVWDDLTVVVVADHGEAFGENDSFRHPYHFWEPNIHVPFILKSPALVGGAGKVEDRLFEGVDLAPTLLDLAGVAPPADWRPSGVSAAAVMAGPPTAGWDRAVYTELVGYGLDRAMVRRGQWKYLRFNPSRLETLKFFWHNSWDTLETANHTDVREYLFDVEADPRERANLIDLRPDLVAEMREELESFQERHEAGGHRRPGRGEDGTEIPDERLSELRSLGYME